MDTKNLSLEIDIGTVWMRDHSREDLVYCGFVGDPDNCPEGLEDEWEQLWQWWDEAGDYLEACLRAARAAFYYGIDPARMN